MSLDGHKIKLKSVNSHIACYLCRGYLIDATTVTECLHTFCKSCLLKYLEDNTVCPKCNTLIHQSHPKNYISYDRTMQDIVYKIVPDLFKKEMARREQFCRERGIAFDNPLGDDSGSKRKDETPVPETSGDYHRNDEQVNLTLSSEGNEVSDLERCFIRCSGQATVTHLKKYVAKKVYSDMEQFQDIDILCNNEMMGKDHTLKFIFRTRWRSKGFPIELKYRRHVEF